MIQEPFQQSKEASILNVPDFKLEDMENFIHDQFVTNKCTISHVEKFSVDENEDSKNFEN